MIDLFLSTAARISDPTELTAVVMFSLLELAWDDSLQTEEE
jgi:hypothetical protein